jgi:RNA polymerase sigma-70 factor (ECF subfamily)
MNPATTESVQALFLQHAAALRGYLLGLLNDRELAQDLFQELFLTVTRIAESFRPDGNFLAWARGIARNKVLEQFRRGKLLPVPFDAELLEMLADTADEEADLWEDRREVLSDCIQQLAPRARQILELRYAEKPLAPPEIAEQLGWTTNAVNVALSRARKFLQECSQRRLQARGH